MAKGTRGGKRVSDSTSDSTQTKVASGKNYGETRGQIKLSKIKVPKEEEFKYMNKKEYAIMQETGVDKETALGYASVVRSYTFSPKGPDGLSATDKIANGTDKASINTLNEMMSKMGTYNGEIYRGMHLSEADSKKFMKNLKVGKEMSMRGVSSWTSDSNIADTFANKGVNSGQAQTQIVFRSKKNKSGVGIEHLSEALLGGRSEAEVLMPSTAKFKVSKITEVWTPRSGMGVKKYIVDVDEV